MHPNARRLVVGAIILDNLEQPTRVFAARRTSPAALAGLWEFPGGKVEDGEAPEAALVREIREELVATISVGPEVPHASGAWPISEKYEMRLYFAAVETGELASGNSHDETRWIAPLQMHTLAWLPSDADAIDAIRTTLLNWQA
ncbi:(deoxy)nucleoside triphosphate pyrophosphohydrolase [Tsukamurella spumae]|uniref:8-oxo-dGTP diphosphatase n=1 Tax=Tsukamurella spumae TaxID=44753 RepID=A0A846WXJ6_9ACTN|nr:NUDIX domain-containing protein [Tsukamurella spumae]NKY17878.1 NUDIX domain-containing protein [Tsukamurella spumae]